MLYKHKSLFLIAELKGCGSNLPHVITLCSSDLPISSTALQRFPPMPVVVSTTHLLLLRYSNWWSCWGVKIAGEWIRFSCYSASCRVDRQVSKRKKQSFFGGDLIRLPVWSFSPSTHDARCYSSHCVCSHNICHKCSLCNRNSQSGLPPSCASHPLPLTLYIDV